MNKGLYVVLTGSKEQIESNQKEIEQFLNKFRRKVGQHENCRSAKIHREIEIDNESLYCKILFDKLPEKLKEIVRGYKGVTLKYTLKNQMVRVYVRGRRWRINKRGKKVYK